MYIICALSTDWIPHNSNMEKTEDKGVTQWVVSIKLWGGSG